ncbi:hypothetical protein NE237_032726 [Protea cynaroides]|uniref:P-type ATPase A domain-containing protein n=1 Tax=Protea cynaroides TaxID=273540 RepID=A0A9Q0L3W9_9MAGN|nr:hypothetical protein NE237_032726 [Protea cynaroides]
MKPKWVISRSVLDAKTEGIRLEKAEDAEPKTEQKKKAEQRRTEMGNFLNLAHNRFSEHEFPHIGNLSALEYLNLSQTGLTGSIPPSITILIGLRVLNLLLASTICKFLMSNGIEISFSLLQKLPEMHNTTSLTTTSLFVLHNSPLRPLSLHSDNTLEALKEIQSVVIREGKRIAKDLVPGDIVELRVGDKVPADLRVLNLISSTVRVEQGSLTGENEAVNKTNKAVPEDTDIQGKSV